MDFEAFVRAVREAIGEGLSSNAARRRLREQGFRFSNDNFRITFNLLSGRRLTRRQLDIAMRTILDSRGRIRTDPNAGRRPSRSAAGSSSVAGFTGLAVSGLPTGEEVVEDIEGVIAGVATAAAVSLVSAIAATALTITYTADIDYVVPVINQAYEVVTTRSFTIRLGELDAAGGEEGAALRDLAEDQSQIVMEDIAEKEGYEHLANTARVTNVHIRHLSSHSHG